MKNKSNYLLFIAIALGSMACSSNNDVTPEPDTLPMIKSFVWAGAGGAPELLYGLNEFGYDADGRITLYATPKQKTSYVYSGNSCEGEMTMFPSGEKSQQQTVTFDSQGRPVLEESTDFDGDVKAVIKSGYDEQGRIATYEFSVSDGRYKRCTFSYDQATGLISDVAVVRRESAEDPGVNLIYRFEYTDKPNPVAFYPECHQWFDGEPAFAFTGIDGYRRDRLIDKVTMSLDGADMQAFSFAYDFTPEGKLTTITETATLYDGNGNVVQSLQAIQLSNIEY